MAMDSSKEINRRDRFYLNVNNLSGEVNDQNFPIFINKRAIVNERESE
jgi:hypothetical protein